jgi:hypothetical protein
MRYVTPLVSTLGGISVWVSYLLVSYAFVSVGCRIDFGPADHSTVLRSVLLGISAVHLGAGAWLLHRVMRTGRESLGSVFLQRLSLGVTAAGCFSTFVTGIPVVLTSVCR